MSFTAAIPNHENNPFLSTSTLPEGTLFIVVGSVFLGIIVIVSLWRVYAIWASHRAATYNETRFTALEPSYGGPFVDPVEFQSNDSEFDLESLEKAPELHPLGVPLNPTSKTRRRKRSKSQIDRMREAQMQGKFFSPTADVLLHGASIPGGLEQGIPGTLISSNASASRLSIVHSGRNSLMKHSSMSSMDLGSRSLDPGLAGALSAGPMGPPTGTNEPLANIPLGPVAGHYRTPSVGFVAARPQMYSSMSPVAGPLIGISPNSSVDSKPSRARKIRPPSTYLDDLIG